MAYFYGRLDEQGNDKYKRPAERPPEVERAHVSDRLRADRVNDARRDVHAPRDRNNFDSGERPALSDLSKRGQVERDAEVARCAGEDHRDGVYPARL